MQMVSLIPATAQPNSPPKKRAWRALSCFHILSAEILICTQPEGWQLRNSQPKNCAQPICVEPFGTCCVVPVATKETRGGISVSGFS